MEVTETAEEAKSNSALLSANDGLDLDQKEKHMSYEVFQDSYCKASMATGRSSENTYGRPKIPRLESIERKAGYAVRVLLNTLPGYTDLHLP
jgi:hypothetical protein